MIRVLFTLLILGLTIYAVLDCVRSEDTKRMVVPTWLWVALILLLPVIGAVIWLAVSRAADANPDQGRRSTPRAPDDDPDFLWYLQQQNKRDPNNDGRSTDDQDES